MPRIGSALIAPPATIAAMPPMVSQIARSVGFPVKNFENCEENESVARNPMTSKTIPTTNTINPTKRRGCTHGLLSNDPVSFNETRR